MTRRPPAPLPWLGALLAAYLIAPFLAGFGQIGLADWRGAAWPELGNASLVSIASATIATLLVAAGGIPLGYTLARAPAEGGRRRITAAIGFLVQLPLALPPLASGVLLLFLLGYASPLGRLTQGALTDSFAGIVLAEAFVAAPFLIIAARSAFAGLDPVLEDVAATLGHRRGSVFRRVSLPITGRAILAGALLAWLRAFGEFGATVMVAYHPYSLPVYTYVAFGTDGLPAMLPVLLPTLLAAIAVMAVAALVQFRHPMRAARAGWAERVPPIAALAPAVITRPPAAGKTLDLGFRRTLDGFQLDIAWRTGARRLAILGASGSGKSMTLRLIAGLDPAPGGTLSFGGRDLARLPPEQRGVAYVPQSYALFPHLPVLRQAAFGVGSTEAAARGWIARLGLAGLENRLPAALSLGQQQRVALARALARPADLLLLDEPFSALDAPLRIELRQVLRALQAELDATTILVTHDPEEAFLLADELLVVQSGHVLQAGPVERVFARPASEAAARLLGATVIASGQAEAAGIALGGGVVIAIGEAMAPGRVGWSVRPENIRIERDGCCQATITEIGTPVAGRRPVALRLGECALRTLIDPGMPIAPGPCRVTIDPAAVQVWPAVSPAASP